MAIYGDIRVSSRDQSVARQTIALAEFGIGPDWLYVDKQSGRDFDRPAYKKLLRRLRADDVPVVKSINCLGAATTRY